MKKNNVTIRPATLKDIPLILRFIRDLATYEKLEHEVVATEDLLARTLFGPKAYAEVLIGYAEEQPVAFALFFHNFSTFLGKPGIYLEDLFVVPEARGQGIGKKMLSHLAKLALERDCGRLEWWVLDCNEPAIHFYRSIGAEPMEEWTVQRVSGETLIKLANAEKA